MATIFFFAAAFFAEIAGTMAGFGSSTVFLPLALFFVDFKTALVLVAFLHISGNLGRLAFFRSGIDKKLIFLFGIPSVLFTVLGASLVNYVSQDALKAALGGFLVVFAAGSFWKPGFVFPANNLNAFIGGSASGFLAGLIGTGGALRGAFLTAFGLEKGAYIATAAAIALAVDATRIPVYFAGGFLDARYYWYAPVLFAAAVAGSFIGWRIVGVMPQRVFRNVVLSVLAVIGIKFVLGLCCAPPFLFGY